MPLNLLKTYPQLLEIDFLNETARTISLKGVFKRDIEENELLNFRGKKIRPIKGEEPAMQLLLRHLTTVEIKVEEAGVKTYTKRIYEPDRSKRLHWVKYHIEETKKEDMAVFSIEERIDGEDRIRTYIYDLPQKYVIVLDPQRSKRDYTLITAYYLNQDYGEKQMKKKLKKRLPDIY